MDAKIDPGKPEKKCNKWVKNLVGSIDVAASRHYKKNVKVNKVLNHRERCINKNKYRSVQELRSFSKLFRFG